MRSISVLSWQQSLIQNIHIHSSSLRRRNISFKIKNDKKNIGFSETAQFTYALFVTTFIWTLTSSPAYSQPLIEELQRLSFGTLAIPSNTSVSRFTFPSTSNNTVIEGQFVLITRGAPGNYRLSGFPAFTPLNVSLDPTTLTATGLGLSESMTVDNYDVSQPTTDALGNAELTLGARLNTSANGNGYADTSYSGTTTLRVDYWQPDENAFVFNSRIIDLEAQLRTTVALNEEQQLHFGTLFARTSTSEQAVLTLSPSGTYTVSEPEGTRLVVLVRPELGVVKVSGAAPFNNLTITPQSTDVLLRHAEFPENAPHFILSTIVTSPDTTGRIDENGELLISIGGTLRTELTASSVIYPSGEYEGTYELTVSY